MKIICERTRIEIINEREIPTSNYKTSLILRENNLSINQIMTKGEFSKSYNNFSQLEPTENTWKTVRRNSVGLKFYRKKVRKITTAVNNYTEKE